MPEEIVLVRFKTGRSESGQKNVLHFHKEVSLSFCSHRLTPQTEWPEDCRQSIWQTSPALNRSKMQALFLEAEYGFRLPRRPPAFIAVGSFTLASGIIGDAATFTKRSIVLLARVLHLDLDWLVMVRETNPQQRSQRSLRPSSGRIQMCTTGVCPQSCHSFQYPWYSSPKPYRKPQSCYPNSPSHVNWTDRDEMLSAALTRLSLQPRTRRR